MRRLLPIAAGAGLMLLAACGQDGAVGNTAGADAAGQGGEGSVYTESVAAARALVRDRIAGIGSAEFREEEVFARDGVAIVCGRFELSTPGGTALNQRYLAIVQSSDVYLEHEMEDGHMDRAFAEYCRN